MAMALVLITLAVLACSSAMVQAMPAFTPPDLTGFPPLARYGVPATALGPSGSVSTIAESDIKAESIYGNPSEYTRTEGLYSHNLLWRAAFPGCVASLSMLGSSQPVAVRSTATFASLGVPLYSIDFETKRIFLVLLGTLFGTPVLDKAMMRPYCKTKNIPWNEMRKQRAAANNAAATLAAL